MYIMSSCLKNMYFMSKKHVCMSIEQETSLSSRQPLLR